MFTIYVLYDGRALQILTILKNLSSNNISPKGATITGQVSLLMWAVGACFAASIKNLPTFEILFFITLCGFLTSSTINCFTGGWSKLKNHPKHIWLIGIIGIFGNDVFYIMSFKYAPAVHADLINYLWPIFVIISSAIFLKESLKINHLLAVLVAFYGIFYLLTDGGTRFQLEWQYIGGYLCAFTAALLWTFYVIISRKYGKTSPEMFSIYSFVGSIIALTFHITYETTVIPSFNEILFLVALGTTSHSLAYMFWDIGIKKGDFKLLGVLSYTSPVLSVFFLIVAGITEYSTSILIASIMVTLASVLASSKLEFKGSHTKVAEYYSSSDNVLPR